MKINVPSKFGDKFSLVNNKLQYFSRVKWVKKRKGLFQFHYELSIMTCSQFAGKRDLHVPAG